MEAVLDDIAKVRVSMIASSRSDNGSNRTSPEQSPDRISPEYSPDRNSPVHSPGDDADIDWRTVYRNADLGPLPTTDNQFREAMLWSSDIEDVLNKWLRKCTTNAQVHCQCGSMFRTIYTCLAIPASVVPLALASLSSVVTKSHTVFIVGMVISGVLSTFIGVLNPGSKAQRHRGFEAHYTELSMEITKELVKPQRHRADADVFLQRIMDRYNHLNNLAPGIRFR
jgi:hypothetical protein